MTQIIEVKNLSAHIGPDELDEILEAVTLQANDDVRPVWKTDVVDLVAIGPDTDWSDGTWRFTIADESLEGATPGLAGEHRSVGGPPSGYAIIGPTLRAGLHPSVTISHEIIEMLGDPGLDQYIKWSNGPTAVYLCRELCDPVQHDLCGYLKGRVWVSDFVLPAYFNPESLGPWDREGKLAGPNTVVYDGYQMRWDAAAGHAMMTLPRPEGRASASFATPFSRRVRRAAKNPQPLIALHWRDLQTIESETAQFWGARKRRFGKWSAATLLLIALLVGGGAWIANSAWRGAATDIRWEWLLVEVTLIGFCVLTGLAANGRIDGIFIDEENRISLSRVQWAAWLVILLGGVFAESVWNVAAGWSKSGSFPALQPQLYALLGIVSGSAVVSGVIVDGKKNTPSPPTPLVDEAQTQKGSIDCNSDPSQASWQDLYMGEEVANRDVVDVSRLQKLIVTILLVMSYVQMLWTALSIGPTSVVSGHKGFGKMPEVGDSFLWLLGISHAAYLAYKATPKTPVAAGSNPHAVVR